MKVVEISCACGNKETLSEDSHKDRCREAARKLGFWNFMPVGLMEYQCPECYCYAICLIKERD